MAELTVLDGAKSLSGTKILFEDLEADTRLIFDFGINFNTVHKFLGKNFMDEVSDKTFEDKFKLYRSVNILPEVKLDNFYYPHIINSKKEFEAISEPFVDGIILSHAHYDCQGHIKYLNPKIPLYASPETIAFYRQMQIRDWKSSCEEEPFYAGNNEKYRQMIPIYHKEEIIFGNGKKRFKVIPHYVDYSIPGAMGFLLITSNGKHIVYAGGVGAPPDGAQWSYTIDFSQFLAEYKPIDLLIIDCTNIDKVDEEPEYIKQIFTLKRKIAREIKASYDKNRMPIVCASGNNLPVIERVYQIAVEMGKKLCVPVYVANLLVKLKESGAYEEKESIVNNLEDLIIYQRCIFEFKDRFSHLEKRYKNLQVVEYNFFNEKGRKNQENCILLLWERDIMELNSIKVKEGSYFIHCHWEPFCEEFNFPPDKLANWMEMLKLNYVSIPITGHMYREQSLRVKELEEFEELKELKEFKEFN